MIMSSLRQSLAILSVIAFAIGVAGCGSTWEGLKADTSKNLEKTGEAIDKAGESMSK
jgi:hypothetical protein